MSWTPQERIRHALPPEEWPTRAQADASLLFSPVSIGPWTARTRTWVPAMVPWRATPDGEVTPSVLDWYRRFAAGRPGVLVVEATGIRDIASGPLLRISHDRFVPGLKRLVEAVGDASAGETLLFIQVIDFLAIRRRPEPAKYFQRFLVLRPEHRTRLARLLPDGDWDAAPEDRVRAALAGLPEPAWPEVLDARELEDLRLGARERVNDLHLPHVRDLPQKLPGLFSDAAARAVEAGFHGVELHYAHAYTMASFLSATNDRTDGYGASREGRVRLPLEVIAAVRQQIGPAALGLRFLADEVVPGGSRIEDAVYYARNFARAGVDFLSVSKGGKFDDARQPRVGEAAYPYTGPSGYECMPTVHSDARGPFGRNLPLASAIRAAVRSEGATLPVVAAGGIGTFTQAEQALRSGAADIIGAARQSLADPDWFRKARLGRGPEVRRCEYTNYCEGLDQRHKQVTCKLWDRLAVEEAGTPLDETGRRRLVAPPWDPGTGAG